MLSAFKDLMTRGSCNSHCVSQFAAFFLVMETEISTVENFRFLVFKFIPGQPKPSEADKLAIMILLQVLLQKPCYALSLL